MFDDPSAWELAIPTGSNWIYDGACNADGEGQAFNYITSTNATDLVKGKRYRLTIDCESYLAAGDSFPFPYVTVGQQLTGRIWSAYSDGTGITTTEFIAVFNAPLVIQARLDATAVINSLSIIEVATWTDTSTSSTWTPVTDKSTVWS